MAAPLPIDRDECARIFQSLGLNPMEAKDLEVGIYNATIDFAGARGIPLTWKNALFVEIYMARSRSIYHNLKTFPKLFERLKEGEFLPHALASLEPDRMDPDGWLPIVQREIMRDKGSYEPTLVAMSDRYYCKMCKKNKVSYVMVQLRSADEPMTMLTSCLVCGYRWKM